MVDVDARQTAPVVSITVPWMTPVVIWRLRGEWGHPGQTAQDYAKKRPSHRSPPMLWSVSPWRPQGNSKATYTPRCRERAEVHKKVSTLRLRSRPACTKVDGLGVVRNACLTTKARRTAKVTKVTKTFDWAAGGARLRPSRTFFLRDLRALCRRVSRPSWLGHRVLFSGPRSLVSSGKLRGKDDETDGPISHSRGTAMRFGRGVGAGAPGGHVHYTAAPPSRRRRPVRWRRVCRTSALTRFRCRPATPGAALHQPGPEPGLRLQPRRGPPCLSRGRAPRSEPGDGATGGRRWCSGPTSTRRWSRTRSRTRYELVQKALSLKSRADARASGPTSTRWPSAIRARPTTGGRATRRTPTRCGGCIERYPERSRRRDAVRRVDDGPAAVGLLAARRRAARGHRRRSSR